MSEQSPELELLDVLLGEDMSLERSRTIFESDEQFRRALAMMVKDGDITPRDASGVELPSWRARAVIREPACWVASLGYKLHITARGSQRV